jgi:hypothetical protein
LVSESNPGFAAGALPLDEGISRGSVANLLFQSFSYCCLGSETEGYVFKGRHFDRSVILLCVRWSLAYSLSLRNLEEMMAERGISVDHAKIHRWVTRYSPELLERFNSRKRAVTGKWHIDETHIKVAGSGGISTARSTAMATPSNSGSATAATWQLPSVSSPER